VQVDLALSIFDLEGEEDDTAGGSVLFGDEMLVS
jgi:hypothetical protein